FEVLDRAPHLREILLRDIDATMCQIVLHVSQNICELEGDTQVERVVARLFALASEDANANHADGRGHPPAVAEEIVKRFVAAPIEIQFHPVDNVLERLARKIEFASERFQ